VSAPRWQHGFPDGDLPVVRADRCRRQIEHWSYARDRLQTEGPRAFAYSLEYAEQRLAYWVGKLIEEAG
jgi:hypothetical protein